MSLDKLQSKGNKANTDCHTASTNRQTDRQTHTQTDIRCFVTYREKLVASGVDHLSPAVLHLIDKDIDRTDRSNPFYEGESNPNLLRLK